MAQCLPGKLQVPNSRAASPAFLSGARLETAQLNYFGRLIPRALMREASVVGLIPSSSAAPPGPYTFQRAWSSAVSTFSRSRPLISASGATVAGGRDSTMAACLGVADGGPE